MMDDIEEAMDIDTTSSLLLDSCEHGMPHIVPLLFYYLNTLIQSRVLDNAALSTPFDDDNDMASLPLLSNFFCEIHREADLYSTCYVVAYMYMERYLDRNAGVRLDSRNVCRLLLTALLVAGKVYDEQYTNSNAIFASIARITLKEMNKLEKELLLGIDFKVTADVLQFNECCFMLESKLQYMKQSLNKCCLIEEDKKA